MARSAPRARSCARSTSTIDDPGAHAFLGSRPTWLWGVEHGVNEHGVAIGNEKIWTVDRPRDHPPALLGMDLVRLGLERSRSADEALAVLTTLLERHGQGGSGEPDRDEPYFSSFLIADPDGGFVVETSNRTWAARPIGAGAAISNRISLGTDWTRRRRTSPPAPTSTPIGGPGCRRHRRPPARGDRRRRSRGANDDRGGSRADLRDHGPTDTEPDALRPVPTAKRLHRVHAPPRIALADDGVDDRRAAHVGAAGVG